MFRELTQVTIQERVHNLFRLFIPAEMAKYVVCGGFAFIVDASILYSLTQFMGWHYLASNTVGLVAGLIITYLLNVKWVFADRKYEFQIGTEFPLFVAIVVTGYLINQVVMWSVVEIIEVDYLFAKVAATAIVLGFNFVAKSTCCFPKRSRGEWPPGIFAPSRVNLH